MGEKKIDYDHLERIRTSALEVQLKEKMEEKSSGRIDSLRHTILRFVVEGSYDTASSELIRYESMQKEYPTFRKRARPYLEHCQDVIQAVKSKRNMPGLQGLPMAKQQELFERVLEHFEELKVYLKKIEIIEKDVKLEDLRSTVLVVKALAYSVFAIVIVVFVRSAAVNIFQSFDYVLDDYVNRSINYVFDLIE